jgi:hypothetical protein
MPTDSHASDILQTLANDKNLPDKIPFEKILTMLGERAFGIGLLFFALPSALPLSTIPGVSFIFSLPIFIVAIQMMLLRKTIWLPKLLAKKTISREMLQTVAIKTTPYLIKIEKLLKPRLLFMSSRFMDIFNGFMITFVSLCLMLPIPLSNFVFSALTIIFSLGLIEEDGLFIIAGYVGTIVYVSCIYGIIFATLKLIF